MHPMLKKFCNSKLERYSAKYWKMPACSNVMNRAWQSSADLSLHCKNGVSWNENRKKPIPVDAYRYKIKRFRLLGV